VGTVGVGGWEEDEGEVEGEGRVGKERWVRRRGGKAWGYVW